MAAVTVTSSSKDAGTRMQSMLDKMKPQIEAALPKHMNADRVARIAMTVFRSNKDFAECEPVSFISSLMTASQLGLEVGILGQAYLIPYKKTCTFVPGWQGLVDLVSRAGRATVWTGAVFEGDEFDYALGDRPYVQHRPGGEDDEKKMTHVYAIGRVNGQEWPIIEVWPVAKVRKHLNRYNKVGERHYANRHFEMYARKVALLQVIKYVPKSIELISAMTADNEADRGRTIEMNKFGDVISITGGEPEQEERQAQIEAPVIEDRPVVVKAGVEVPAEMPPGNVEVLADAPPPPEPTTKVGNRTVSTRTGEVLD